MSYRVIQSGKEFSVVEKETEHVVYSVGHVEPANRMCRDLNLGAGFAGWTPNFFVNQRTKVLTYDS